MSLIRRLLLVAIAGVPVACAPDSTAPRGALVGRWGRENVNLVAKARAVVVEFPCVAYVGTAPLIPDPDGHFVYQLDGGLKGPPTVTMTGSVTGETITFELDPPYRPSGEPFTVSRNVYVGFSGAVCVSSGS